MQLSNKRELMQIDLGQASEEEHSDLADELDEQSDENDSDSDAAPVSKAPAAAPARRSTRRGRPTAPMLDEGGDDDDEDEDGMNDGVERVEVDSMSDDSWHPRRCTDDFEEADEAEVPEEYVRLCAQEDEDDKWFGDD